jgi:hypothetical protein
MTGERRNTILFRLVEEKVAIGQGIEWWGKCGAQCVACATYVWLKPHVKKLNQSERRGENTGWRAR